jgi:hypothetical protein
MSTGRTLAAAWRAFVLACALASGDAEAYSYSAAGAEPLIDAREATLAALESKDAEAARKASAAAAKEIEYLDQNHGTRLAEALEAALRSGDAKRVDRVYQEGFAAEIRRRIAAAGGNLSDYQTAKALVVKSKRFLDLLAPHLGEGPRASAQKALEVCLGAIGNPGVFGVGAAPPDPAAFQRGAADLLRSLDTL